MTFKAHPRKARLALGITLSAVVGLLSTGCKTVSQSDYDAAIEENTELRQRITSLQDNLEDANAAQRSLADENARLTSDLNIAQSQTPVNSGGNAGAVFGGNNGFAEGTSTRIGDRGEVIVTLASDVFFASGQATIKKASEATLNQIANTIVRNYPNRTVRVEGYTDSDPIRKSKWDSNEHLSTGRALAVEKYLVSRGVDNNQVYSAGFGASKPKGTKATSRRVEIVILND